MPTRLIYQLLLLGLALLLLVMSTLSFSIEQGKGAPTSKESRLEAILLNIEANGSNVSIDLMSALEREVITSLSALESNPLLTEITAVKANTPVSKNFINITDAKKNHGYQAHLLSNLTDFPVSSLSASASNESTPPVLSAISVDKVSIDVSQSPQTITFTVDATDDSGIDWSAGVNSTGIVYQDAGGGYHYAPGNNANPGKLVMEVTSDDKGGTWKPAFLALTDNNGNKVLYGRDALSEFGLPTTIEVFGGIESTPPVLSAISVDKVSIDVSQSPQTITFTVDATDDSGIDWSAGVNSTGIVYQDAGGGYHYAPGNNANPGKLVMEVTSDDKGGTWKPAFLALTDNNGNKVLYGRDALSEFGLPTFLYILTEGEITSDITLSAASEIAGVAENSNVTYALKIENRSDNVTGQLNFGLNSSNLRVNSVALVTGSSACTISTVNYNSTVSCALSELDPNSSTTLNLDLTTGLSGFGHLNADIIASIPDVSYLDNYLRVSLAIIGDDDGDGILDNIDNCIADANADQLDSDSDTVGDACDALHLNPSETVDTDTDGIGNNADTDDDGDGLSDSQEATYGTNPLVSDSDNDGYSDNEEITEGTDPLDANSAPVPGLSLVLIKAFLDRQEAAQQAISE